MTKLNTQTVYTLFLRTIACGRHPDLLFIHRIGCSPKMKPILWWEGAGLQNIFWITFDCSGWGQSCMPIKGNQWKVLSLKIAWYNMQIGMDKGDPFHPLMPWCAVYPFWVSDIFRWPLGDQSLLIFELSHQKPSFFRNQRISIRASRAGQATGF